LNKLKLRNQLDDVIASLFEKTILNRICSHFVDNNYKPVLEVFLNEIDVVETCFCKKYANHNLELYKKIARKIFLNENDSIQKRKTLSDASQDIISAFKCLEAFKLTRNINKLLILKTMVNSKMLAIEYFQINNLKNEHLSYLTKLEKLHLSNYNENNIIITADTFLPNSTI
jgi:hypothetical protein